MTEAERQKIKAFSKRMRAAWHNATDSIRAIRCATLHQNCQRMLNDDESPELKRAFKANLDDLMRYDAGYYWFS